MHSPPKLPRFHYPHDTYKWFVGPSYFVLRNVTECYYLLLLHGLIFFDCSDREGCSQNPSFYSYTVIPLVLCIYLIKSSRKSFFHSLKVTEVIRTMEIYFS